MTSSTAAHELALQLPSESGLTTQDAHALALAGQVANEQAARSVFADYLSRKVDNTIRRQAADLARFAAFLDQAGEGVGLQLGAALAAFAQGDMPQPFPRENEAKTSALHPSLYRPSPQRRPRPAA